MPIDRTTFRCGHPRSAENVYVNRRRNKPDREQCRTCKQAYARRRKESRTPEQQAEWLATQRRYSQRARERRKLPDPSIVLPKLGGWVDRALCGNCPSIDWTSDDRFQQNRAANACYDCPVMFECGQYAVDNQVPWGVWGGLTPRDRGWTVEGARRRDAA